MNRNLIQKILAACLLAAGAMARAQETNTNTIARASAATNSVAVTNSYATTDFRSFELISKRNIFDPTRSGTRPRPTYTRPPRVDSFTLVGTMSYEKGQFAFFDGSSSDYRKTLKPADKIAGYKIMQIADDHIVLSAASNQTINLPVGTRMRRQEGGAWRKTGGAEAEETPSPTPTATATPSTDTATPAMTGTENDAMKRLMLKRLSEK